MRMSKIEIQNFKGLKNILFEPGKFTCLVGENNAGKSSVLQAINMALKLTTEIPESLFYDSNLPVIFKIFISDITESDLKKVTEEQRTKISPYVDSGLLKLGLIYRVSEKLSTKIFTLVPKDQRFSKDNLATLIAGAAAAYNANLRTAFPEWIAEMPTFRNQGDARRYIEEKISALSPDAFQEGQIDLPTGIAPSVKALIPEPIYIPAVKNIADDLKIAQSTNFGRLISLLLEDLSPDLETISKSLDQLKTILNRVNEGGVIVDKRHQKVKDLEAMVEGYLKTQFPRVKLEFEIPPPELKTILNSAKIYVNDGSRDLIDNKGDGIKRSLTFSLLRVYVEQLEKRKQALTDGDPRSVDPLIFLFEEPELYLHPRSQQILFGALGKISSQHPVIVTTHSPIFFSPGVTASFVRVKKEEATPKPVGRLYPVNFDLDSSKSESFQLAKFEHAEPAFFCSKVVLFEGESDGFFLKHLAKTLKADWNFEEHNIGLIKVSGKGNFQKFREFFEAFGVDVFIIADLDTLVDGFDKLGASAEHAQVRSALLQKLDKRALDLGIKHEFRAKKIRTRIRQNSFQEKYYAAKNAIEECQKEKKFSDSILATFKDLFHIEEDDKRYQVLRSDEECKKDILTLLDSLRTLGICILSKGTIEDYYPPDTLVNDSKPSRALAAIQLIEERTHALALSTPFLAGRNTEFEEIFESIF